MVKLSKKDKKYLREYAEILNDLPNIIEKRNDMLAKFFPEIFTIFPVNDSLETRIENILDKLPNYPFVFLAHFLGFTKMSWNKSVEKILGKFNLEMKLKHPTFKNYRKYETLKLLLIKYLEKRKENTF